MFIYPYLTLFLFTLFSSTIIALSSYHWIIVWIAIELNIISFIPLISSSNWLQESEASLNYFLFQAIGSTLLLLGTINFASPLTILMGLTIKLGTAPFHFWFPSVINSIPWPAAGLLITWQKLAPLLLLISSFHLNKTPIIAIGLLSALAGAIGGFSQTQLRPLLAYSSIGHIGWIISASTISPSVSILYLASYITISTPIIWSAFITNINNLNSKSLPTHSSTNLLLLITIISLSGLPPLLGFAPNVLALISFSSLLAPLILLFSSLINLSYYLNFFFTLSLWSPSPSSNNKSEKAPGLLSFMCLISTSPIPLIFVFWALF